MSALDFPAWAVSEEQQELFATAVGFNCPSILLHKENTTKNFVDANHCYRAPAVTGGKSGDDIAMGFARLDLKQRESTPTWQATASTFCAEVFPLGFGYLPLSCQFDPTYQNEVSLSRIFAPSTAEIASARPLFICAEGPGLQRIAKDATFGTMHSFFNAMKESDLQLRKICVVSNERTSFRKHNVSVGIANETSYHDADIRVSNMLIAVAEGKGSDSSILPPLSQAAVEATNFCLGLYNHGVPKDFCIVPVIAYNGLSICFGATMLLDETFPTFVPVSKVLSLLDESESQVASAYIRKVLVHAQVVSILAKVPRIPLATKMELIASNYYIKRITKEVFNRGFGLFTDSTVKTDIQNGLCHMIRCLNRIYNSPAREVAEYPISVRTPDETDDSESSSSCYELIFNNLIAQGFATGVPNRVENPRLYDAFVTELHRVVKLVHDAGVIHVDLFASNIMWKEEQNGALKIKIIDWDASHSLMEGKFAPRVVEKLKDGLFRWKPREFGVDYDLFYLKVYCQNVADNEKDWISLSSSEKKEIDNAFGILMHEMFM